MSSEPSFLVGTYFRCEENGVAEPHRYGIELIRTPIPSPTPTMKQVQFSEMQEADLPAVLEIYNHYIATTTATFDPGPISMDTLTTRVRLGHALYGAYVIRLAGEFAGFSFLCPFKQSEAYKRTAELGLYLKPEYIRQGLGTKAVDHLVNTATVRGLRMLVASVSGENTGSISLFRKIEWQQCAHFREIGEKWGRSVDIVFFQKKLENDPGAVVAAGG